jgi:hypothetical protein
MGWPLADHNRLILEHLRRGDAVQRAAARSIARTGVLKLLKPYAPLIVGTLPLDVHLPESDVDVICHVRAPKTFMSLLVQRFGDLPQFTLGRTTLQRKPAVVCGFRHRHTQFEIVGMPVPTHTQRAYVHLMAEADLLGASGAHAAIRRLKRRGLKTEPAFARHFRLGGDPYQAVAKLWRRRPVSG